MIKRLASQSGSAVCLLVVSLALLACSPALNWREVRVGSLTALLPCKPDKAQRQVQLGPRLVPMELQACEAQSTLFAVSYIALQSPAHASAVAADWRAAALANMRSTNVLEQPYAFKGIPSHAEAVQIMTQGTDAKGALVQAKLAWWVSGAHVFHLAVYGPQLSDELTQPLFSELRFSP